MSSVRSLAVVQPELISQSAGENGEKTMLRISAQSRLPLFSSDTSTLTRSNDKDDDDDEVKRGQAIKPCPSELPAGRLARIFIRQSEATKASCRLDYGPAQGRLLVARTNDIPSRLALPRCRLWLKLCRRYLTTSSAICVLEQFIKRPPLPRRNRSESRLEMPPKLL